jgi:hypothetical protein
MLIAKNKILVIMDTCDYKPCSHLRQVAKENQSQKIPCGMYNHTSSRISLVVARIFHLLTSCRIMRVHIQLHKTLCNILKIIKFK